MPRVLYSVIAMLPDESTAQEYIGWLRGGHIAEVVRAGAESGMVVRVDSAERPRVVAQYVFGSRAALERYIAEDAPRLRADGLAKFPQSRGVLFERQVGSIEHAEQRSSSSP
jgi:hypothetical protein